LAGLLKDRVSKKKPPSLSKPIRCFAPLAHAITKDDREYGQVKVNIVLFANATICQSDKRRLARCIPVSRKGGYYLNRDERSNAAQFFFDDHIDVMHQDKAALPH
jgi:hypothetical protein